MLEFTLPPTLVISLIVGVVLPIIVGLVTTRVTNSGTRAVILAALAAATGLLSELGDSLASSTPYDIGVGSISALAAFLVAVGLHFGLYKPTGVSDKAQGVGSRS